MTMFRTASALVALLAATPALAQTPTADELAVLVRQQAAEIATLRARLDRLEGAQQVAATPAPAPAPAHALQITIRLCRDPLITACSFY